MIFSIFFTIFLGHTYVALAIFWFKILIFKEIISLKQLTYESKDYSVNLSKKLCWYFFFLEELLTHIVYFEDLRILMNGYFEFQ